MAVPSRLKVAVAQIDCVLGDRDANLRKHLAFIDEASSAGADVLLFPELSLTGYHLGMDTLRLAMERQDSRLHEIADAATGITVVLGYVDEGPAAQLYNAAIVARDGQITFLHRKLNLPTYGNLEEGKLFAAGRYIETFPLDGPWRGSILICADLWNPALVHLAMVQGATLLLAPTNSAVDAVSSEFSNPHGWDLVLRFYAMMYGMPVAMANRVGVEKGARFWGGSRILDPFGKVIAQAEGEHEQLIVADIDYEAVREARFQLPTVRDSNLNLLHREIERVAATLGVPEIIRRS